MGSSSPAKSLRAVIPIPGARTVDSLLGAVLGLALGFTIAWVLGAVALQTPGLNLRSDVQRSKVLSFMNRHLPPSSFLLNALARFDQLPKVHGSGATGIAPVDTGTAAAPAVARAGAGVVRVLGNACGLGIEGSGWVASGSLVVTNAHVVAGEHDTTVQVGGGGPKLRAHAVVFDATNDIAVLRVSGLDAPALHLAQDTSEGRSAAVLGFRSTAPTGCDRPVWDRRTRSPARTPTAAGPVQRSVVTFRGVVQSGNSGGPLVDADGEVVGTVFASAVGDGPHGGYAVPDAVVGDALGHAGSRTVSTGPCST